MLAREVSESESDSEILQKYLDSSNSVASSPASSDFEELEASLAASLPTVQEYSLAVEFKKVVCEKIEAISERDAQIKQLWYDVIANKKVKKEGSDEKK